jgi:hypothetical protein
MAMTSFNGFVEEGLRRSDTIARWIRCESWTDAREEHRNQDWRRS